MKKMASAIPVAAIFCILAFLFVNMCLPQRQNSEAALAFDLYFLRTRGLYCAVLGAILLAAFYHLTLYLSRRRELVYLLFSIMCLVSVTRFLFAAKGLNDDFKWIPAGLFSIRFNGAMAFLYHYSITILGLYVFSRQLLLKHKMTFALYLAFGIAWFSFVPIDAPYYKPGYSLFIMVVCLFVMFVAFRSPIRRENLWTRLYFISFILYFGIGIVHNLLLMDVFFMPGLLSNLFMVLSQSLMLSKNYTNAFRLVEETNLNLEQLVDERTKSLQAANAAMLSANSAMKELVSNISHDLKTPLSILSVNLEALSGLAETKSDADYQRHVRTAYQKNLDLQRLIQNLFEVNRIEIGRTHYAPRWESLLPLLARAREKYDDFLEDIGIFLDMDVEDDIEIWTDPQKIWSVFDNIIYNAARYTQGGGSVTIAARNMQSCATVTITDTGCGILAEQLPHIFERFYRGSPARGTKEGESGLGLYIAARIMEGCGGSATARSEPGAGTSIVLTFPARMIA